MPATYDTDNARTVISESVTDLTIVIPVMKDKGGATFLGLWLCGWAFGEVIVAYVIVAGLLGIGPVPVHGMTWKTAIIAGLWLAGWTAGGVVAMYQLLWLVAGREEVLATAETLCISDAVPGWRRTRNYDMLKVSDLRAGYPFLLAPDVRLSKDYYRGGACIMFRDGGKAKAFGRNLGEEDARAIVEAFRRRFPAAVAAEPYADFADEGDEQQEE